MEEVQDTQFSTGQQLLNTIKLKVEERKGLTLDDIKVIAPSVGTPAPNADVRKLMGLSDKYVHVPTTQVIEDIIKMGWTPIDATQVNRRKSRKGRNQIGFQKHMIKFVNYDFIKEDTTEYPELLLTNSHDGLCSFKLDVGIFRLICSNGMVIKSQDFGSMKVRHMGYDFETIQNSINELMESIPGYIKQVDTMKETKLEENQLMEFAKKAALLRFEKEKEDTIEERVDVQALLESTRKEDRGNYLWEVFNRVQEKIVGGKFTYVNGEKIRKARPIKNFQQNVKVNQELWALAEEFVN